MKKIFFTAALIGMTGFMAQPAFAGDGGCKSKACTCKTNCKDDKCTMKCCTGKDDKTCTKDGKKCTKDCSKDSKSTSTGTAATK